jgi:hypothetical protein
MSGVPKKKQAVVLIHGVGEQVPMDTLRGFVRTVWTTDDTLRPAPPVGNSTIWSKPDDVSKNYELRRLTTAFDKNGRRTDFFELYWADLMTGTRISDIIAWAQVLIFRRPSRIPKKLRPLRLIFIILGCAIFIGAIARTLDLIPGPSWLDSIIGFTVGILWAIFGHWIISIAGDAARYLHVAPSNIESRRKVRDAGTELLSRLHDSEKYDRIILVGHSLGTVIGYDILTNLWPRFNDTHNLAVPKEPGPALRKAEKLAANELPSDNFVEDFQAASRQLHEELSFKNKPWLVTDFVTLGAPLTYADVLMAKDEADLMKKKGQREFPTCPPILECDDGVPRFSYRSDGAWVPHHAALFGATRWTNLYFPSKWTFWGDIIGGPVAPMFGKGIKDVPVETTQGKGFFSHTHYWDFPPGWTGPTAPPHIARLREAVRICE